MYSDLTGGSVNIIFGKRLADAFGLPINRYYVAVGIVNRIITNGYVCNNGAVVTVPLTATTISGINGASILIESNNGTVRWFANGTLVGTSAGGPTVNALGVPAYELSSNGTSANYNYRITSESFGE